MTVICKLKKILVNMYKKFKTVLQNCCALRSDPSTKTKLLINTTKKKRNTV